MRIGRMLVTLLATLVGTACAAPEPAGDLLTEPDDTRVESAGLPIDFERMGAVAEAANWPYRRELETDLDGDGRAERLVLGSDVSVEAAGRPLWEDAHRWAVYVVEDDASTTLLYGRLVPFGRVEVAVTRSGDRPRVTVHERGPHRRQAWEIDYAGPGSVRAIGQVGGPTERGPESILEPD